VLTLSIKKKILSIKEKIELNKLRNNILNYYKETKEVDEEIRQVLDFLNHQNLFSLNSKKIVFPYALEKAYRNIPIEINYDKTVNMYFVNHFGKKLYYPKLTNPKRIPRHYRSLCLEQDIKSPHCYINDNFKVNDGDICVDIGCAEGNFSLGIIEKVSKLYLFETKKEWIEALEATFEPWKHKVEIINKFVSDQDTEECMKLDTFFIEKKVNFIKMDAEGAEEKVLSGAKELLTRNNIKLVVTTYHRANDANLFSTILKKFGFKITYSNGFMIFIHDPKLSSPYLRKGLIRAEKNIFD
jgi:hypothetical protein